MRKWRFISFAFMIKFFFLNSKIQCLITEPKNNQLKHFFGSLERINCNETNQAWFMGIYFHSHLFSLLHFLRTDRAVVTRGKNPLWIKPFVLCEWFFTGNKLVLQLGHSFYWRSWCKLFPVWSIKSRLKQTTCGLFFQSQQVHNNLISFIFP